MTAQVPFVPGVRYGLLVAISESERKISGGRPKRQVSAKCDCGTVKDFDFEKLRYGTTQSCGCLQRQRSAESATIHGMNGTRTYHTWACMLARCKDEKNKRWSRYGGRGIKVCKRWLKFQNFYKDMGAAPPDMQIDRIDNDGDYCPENCRWVTHVQQQNNRSTNRIISACGESMTLMQWARKSGIHWGTIKTRLDGGWLPNDAVTLRPDLHRKYAQYRLAR